ncbi:MAG: DNA alkylation repair protein [Methanocella sp.]
MPGVDEIVEQLRSLSSPDAKAGMNRVGIRLENALGVDTTSLKRLATEIGRDHALALALWDTGIYEAMTIAVWIDDPAQVTEEQMDRWAADFKSWDLCDHACFTLFDKTPYGFKKCREWAADDREYVKRAGFAMMAGLAIHDKKSPDETIAEFFPLIVKGASDERHMVKKAVSWALRQTGKRNLALNAAALAVAEEIKNIGGGSARWIASDATRELKSDAVRARLEKWDAKKKAGTSAL